MKFNLQKRRASRRDFSYHKSHKLGAVVLPDEFLISSTYPRQNAEDCTAFSACGARDSEVLNANFDPMAFWNDELAFKGVATSDGFDIEVPAAVACKVGFSPMGNPTLRQNQPSAYFWIHPNNGQDLFDSVRTAIFNSKYPVCGGMDWFNEYTNVPQGKITSIGQSLLGGHAIRINGWTTIDGVLYMSLPNTWGVNVGQGGNYFMTREVFNKAFASYGIYLWSDDPNAKIKTLGLIQALYQNIITLIKAWLNQPKPTPEPVIVPDQNPPAPVQPQITPPIPSQPVMPVSKIQIWAKSIQAQEGGKPTNRNMINNNPGNIKYTSYAESLGATTYDKDNFCIFPTYQMGFTALCKFLIDACENNLLVYHNVTLDEFTTIYASPPNKNYVNAVAQALGVPITVLIKTFL